MFARLEIKAGACCRKRQVEFEIDEFRDLKVCFVPFFNVFQ